MKNLKISKGHLITVCAFAFLFSTQLRAGLNVEEQMDQLKTNAENSESNYEQYKKNYEISTKNLSESNKAIKELNRLKGQLAGNGNSVEKNKKALQRHQEKIEKFKKAELAKIKTDQKQMESIKALMEQLQRNIEKRELNVAAYDEKVQEIEAERVGWDTQKGELVKLKGEIESRIKTAKDEKTKWSAKKLDYKKEHLKWKKHGKVARQQYSDLQKLND